MNSLAGHISTQRRFQCSNDQEPLMVAQQVPPHHVPCNDIDDDCELQQFAPVPQLGQLGTPDLIGPLKAVLVEQQSKQGGIRRCRLILIRRFAGFFGRRR